MKVPNGIILIACLTALVALTSTGCSNGDDKIVIPNKPPLSAEAAKQRAMKQQQDRIKYLQDQFKRRNKSKK